MEKNTKILIVIVITIIAGLLLYYFNGTDKEFQTESWTESYSPEDKGPYGTYVFKELLDTTGIFESFIQIDGKIEEQLVDNEYENDIYFFIGKENYISETAFDQLLDFVSNGNTALISAQNMPEHVLDFFFLKMNHVYEKVNDSTQSFNLIASQFSDKEYDFTFINNNKTIFRNWVYFKPGNFVYQSGAPKVLGKNNSGKVNFIKIPYGEGAFFLHTNPYQFTNIALFRFDGFNYSEDLIHYLPYGKIQWDIYNLNYHYFDHQASNSGGGNGGEKRSIFQFVFQHQTLTWAFCILAITGLSYAFFKGKRRQNIIEAVDLKENSSLSYIETVSSLYLQERKHNKLVKHQQKSFIDFISSHYYIRSHKIDDAFISKVSSKSGVDKTILSDIFVNLETISNQTKVTDRELILLQQKIEHFYKTCK